jgi:glycosyltransferase involved in cell wall biosynthesis
MEAQSQGLACLSTRLPGIGELIEDGITGILMPPGDPPALARALEALIGDPAQRMRLGLAGEARVRHAFDMRIGIAELAALFGLPEQPLDQPMDGREDDRRDEQAATELAAALGAAG